MPIKPRAVIMIGAYTACAKFIRIARRSLPDAMYLNVSFVGSTALRNALGDANEGVVITQVVPHFESDLPLVEAYRRDLLEHNPGAEPGFVSLEGYIVARIFVEGLRRAGPTVDRESIIDAPLGIRSLDIGLGTPIRFSDESYQASQTVWPTIIREGRFEPFAFDYDDTGRRNESSAVIAHFFRAHARAPRRVPHPNFSLAEHREPCQPTGRALGFPIRRRPGSSAFIGSSRIHRTSHKPSTVRYLTDSSLSGFVLPVGRQKPRNYEKSSNQK